MPLHREAGSPLGLATRLSLYLLAALLALAAIDKALHYSGFVNAVRSYINGVNEAQTEKGEAAPPF